MNLKKLLICTGIMTSLCFGSVAMSMEPTTPVTPAEKAPMAAPAEEKKPAPMQAAPADTAKGAVKVEEKKPEEAKKY